MGVLVIIPFDCHTEIKEKEVSFNDFSRSQGNKEHQQMNISLFVFQSLENLGTAEEVRSKRHSTSELGNITYSDIRREGWLHYKQILTEKGKVGTPGLITKIT